MLPLLLLLLLQLPRVVHVAGSGEPEQLGHDDARERSHNARAVALVPQDKAVRRAQHGATTARSEENCTKTEPSPT